MLTKRKLPRGRVHVTFTMPPLADVTSLHLVGDFNNWNIIDAHPLAQAADASWSATLTLPAGRSYQYRYLANGMRWYNDWEADAYVPNEHGSENSVLDLTPAALPGAKKASASSPGGLRRKSIAMSEGEGSDTSAEPSGQPL